MLKRIIWQYWETIGKKPAYIDGLHRLTAQNAGVETILVTPETLRDHLPDLPEEIQRIENVAHKADMIRVMLVHRHGGMWLDSDAIVLRDLNPLFDLLDRHEFVGFNDRGRLRWLTYQGRLRWRPAKVRINCFLSRPGGGIVGEWMRQQHAKFPRTSYAWTEIGSDLLHPICLAHRDKIKVLPFEKICPINWHEVAKFTSKTISAERTVRKSYMVMMSNIAVGSAVPELQDRTIEDIAGGDYLLSGVVRHAMRRANEQFAPGRTAG